MQLKHSNDEAITFPGRKVVIGGNVAVDAVAIYDDCRMTYSPLEYKKNCPHCRRESTYLAAGEELNIKAMEPC